MKVYLIITKYPRWAIPFAIISMALFRLPLWLHQKISFWALMGSGKNGSFDLQPDLRQWAILLVQNPEATIPSFITMWNAFFSCKTITYLLEPIEGHGLWNGKKVFGNLPKQSDYEGEIAVLTRATIRISKLVSFWKNVPLVAGKMHAAKGLLQSYGIGEIPFIKQATFSIWENKAAMKNFAYQMKEHQDVIRKTHAEHWYQEEMFVRFKVIATTQTV